MNDSFLYQEIFVAGTVSITPWFILVVLVTVLACLLARIIFNGNDVSFYVNSNAMIGFLPGGSKSLKDTFLILGPSGSGKTCMFCHLKRPFQYFDVPKTQLSLRTNEIIVPIKNLESLAKNNTSEYSDSLHIKFVDVPGHSKLFNEWSKYDKNRIAGIIFMVDRAIISKDPGICAEFLFQVITDPKISKDQIPILICCNKSDLPQSVPMNLVKASLYEELHNLIHTKHVSGITMEEVSTVINGGPKIESEDEFDDRRELLQNRLDDLEQKLVFFQQQSAKEGDGLPMIKFISTSFVKQTEESLDSIAQWILKIIK